MIVVQGKMTLAMPFSQLFDLNPNPNKAHKVIVGTVKDGIK